MVAIAFGAAAIIAPGAIAQAPANQAAAQTWPRQVVPAAEGVVMRCGAGVAWYPVAAIPPGSVLKADAEVDGWLRVEYLPGTTVVVKADEADLKESEQKVVLNRRSRLRALSQADPVFEESFRPVFEEFLAPGRFLPSSRGRVLFSHAGSLDRDPADLRCGIGSSGTQGC